MEGRVCVANKIASVIHINGSSAKLHETTDTVAEKQKNI